MCHCIFLGINPRVTLHHAFHLYHTTHSLFKCQLLYFWIWYQSTKLLLRQKKHLPNLPPAQLGDLPKPPDADSPTGRPPSPKSVPRSPKAITPLSSACWEANACRPVKRMTERCKNITFLQTSFAGDNYLFLMHQLHVSEPESLVSDLVSSVFVRWWSSCYCLVLRSSLKIIYYILLEKYKDKMR